MSLNISCTYPSSVYINAILWKPSALRRLSSVYRQCTTRLHVCIVFTLTLCQITWLIKSLSALKKTSNSARIEPLRTDQSVFSPLDVDDSRGFPLLSVFDLSFFSRSFSMTVLNDISRLLCVLLALFGCCVLPWGFSAMLHWWRVLLLLWGLVWGWVGASFIIEPFSYLYCSEGYVFVYLPVVVCCYGFHDTEWLAIYINCTIKLKP